MNLPAKSMFAERLSNRLAAGERLLAVGMLLVIITTMSSQVIARYVFRSPFPWSEELSRFSMIWLTYLAAAFMMAERGHITVDLWSNRLTSRVRAWYDAFVCAVIAGTCSVLLYGGIPFVYYVHPVGSPALGIPKSIWYGAVSVGLAMMALHALCDMLVLIKTGQPFAPPKVIESEGHS
jgi:TRAP-type C4-dicarboxylate transport system permease small subunit